MPDQNVNEAAATAVAGIGAGFIFFCLFMVALYVVAIWKIFTKAGKPGWASLVPIYNIIVLLEICDKPLWWFLLLLIPLVNVIFAILLYVALAEAFGKGVGFAIGLLLLGFVFFPVLAFSDAQYRGARATA